MKTIEVCGEETPNGPCTLKKGHRLGYHRHRIYNSTMWSIETPTGIVLEEGTARVPMNYAISRCFENGHNDIIIRILQSEYDGMKNDTP